ncbi:hypothetical protein PIROE2DRAFT_8294 [Piromyces sp. E2]|nr:hypothetical protein PIROE2DRAFT_8294 [Piromyces sp. E2]|eukprot:OUM64832.1 hypothetical protein PIROE2DRAFT_8294 [Piromyces sp. E2]
MSHEPDSPSNPFSDCHSTNTPININKPSQPVSFTGGSIKERSNFFEQQAKQNYQNNVLKSPVLRPPVRTAPLSPTLRQSQAFFEQQSKSNNETNKRTSYLNNVNKNNVTSIYTNNLVNKQTVIDNPFSDSNKIAASPSEDGSPTSNKYLDSGGQKGNINKPPSPLVPNKPLALRTSPRISVSANSINPNKRYNETSPQTVGLSNDLKKLHLNVPHNETLVNPFSPVDPTPSPVTSDELGTGTSPLIKSNEASYNNHHHDKHGKKRLSVRAGIMHKEKVSTFESNVTNDNHHTFTLSPESIQPNQTYSTQPSRPVPIPKASTVSGSSNSFRQNMQMPVLEPSPASRLRNANIKHSVTVNQVHQQPPPIPERPNFHNQIQIDGIHASNTISSVNNFGDKMASRRAVINIDSTKANRATPYADGYSKIELSTKHHSKCIAFCNQYLFSGSSNLSVYNTKTGMPSNMVAIDEKIKITSILLVPGHYLVDEGNIVWVGCDKGIIYEIDINTSRIIQTHALSSYPIINMFYCNNKIWAITEKNVAIWTRHETTNDFALSHQPTVEYNLSDIPDYDHAYVLDDKLWLCSQKSITVLGPYPHFSNKKTVNLKVLMGKITCIAEAGLNCKEIYTGHDDGKITVWDSENVVAKESFSVSYYNITSILTVNDKHVWVGLSTGKICVFDSSIKPWKKIKDFEAHFHSGVVQLTRDPFYPYALVPPYTSVANSTLSVVASLSEDGDVHFWDAFLSEDYISKHIYIYIN